MPEPSHSGTDRARNGSHLLSPWEVRLVTLLSVIAGMVDLIGFGSDSGAPRPKVPHSPCRLSRRLRVGRFCRLRLGGPGLAASRPIGRCHRRAEVNGGAASSIVLQRQADAVHVLGLHSGIDLKGI